jgi:hypothetical protein
MAAGVTDHAWEHSGKKGATDMAEEKFETNLLRAISAEIFVLVGMEMAREMFGKSYFALGVGEKGIVDQQAFGMIGGNYNALTAEFLKTQGPKGTLGFQIPTPGVESPRSQTP